MITWWKVYTKCGFTWKPFIYIYIYLYIVCICCVLMFLMSQIYNTHVLVFSIDILVIVGVTVFINCDTDGMLKLTPRGEQIGLHEMGTYAVRKYLKSWNPFHVPTDAPPHCWLLLQLKQTEMLLCFISPAGNRSSHSLRSPGAAKGIGPSLFPGLETITTKKGIVWLWLVSVHEAHACFSSTRLSHSCVPSMLSAILPGAAGSWTPPRGRLRTRCTRKGRGPPWGGPLASWKRWQGSQR